MSKPLTEAQLSTRAARNKLSLGVHWRGIDPQTHLGYRKARRGGTWLVRIYIDRRYRQSPLGTADDAVEADGQSTLDFRQAEQKGRAVAAHMRAEALAKASGPDITVRNAILEYIDERDRRERLEAEKGLKRDAHSRLTKHVLGTPLAYVVLAKLDDDDLDAWLKSLPERLAPSTKKRLVNDLKAALNRSYEKNRKRLPSSLPATIKFGLRTDEAWSAERRRQILSDASLRRILEVTKEVDSEEGWDGDLLRLIAVLAHTGTRFSQAKRLKVEHVQPQNFRLLIPVSKKGKGKKPVELTRISVNPEIFSLLTNAISEQSKDTALLQRWRKKQAKGGEWLKDKRGPWQSASEISRPWNRIIQRCGLGSEIVPYALRHTSIARHLMAGLSVRHVAALHDTSVSMIEKHYAAYIVDAMDEVAAKAILMT